MLRFKIKSIGVLSFSVLLFVNILWTLRLWHNQAHQVKWNQERHSKPDRPANSSVDTQQKNAISVVYSNCLEAEDKSDEKVYSTPQHDLAFQDIRFEIGRWDTRNQYKMYDFSLVGDKFIESSNANNVCLATQSSIERMHSLVQVAHQWHGPISVALFSAGTEEFSILQHYVTFMRLCFESIQNFAVFHLAVPKNRVPINQHKTLFSADRFDCKYPEQTLKFLLSHRSLETIKWRFKNEYPQNVMRNLARKGCQNNYVFLTDVDIIPSPNIVPQLNEFLKTTRCKNSRCAYVIPTFEIDIRAKFPSDKAELHRLYKKGLARPFHERVLIYNQYATNFSSWFASNRPGNDVYISHPVTNFEFLYEPFYISLNDVPPHDERFLGYGFTRNSQVYEMYVAGYTFHVLAPVFSCHWGLQQKKSRPAWREQQNNANRRRFEVFKSEVFARYKTDPLKMFSSKKTHLKSGKRSN